jgi:hypothetical protein
VIKREGNLLQEKNRIMEQAPFDYGRKKKEKTFYKPFVAGL